jgi:hypothetical protein
MLVLQLKGRTLRRMPDDPVERVPRLRRAPIPADASIVVRGLDDDEPEASLRQARIFSTRYPDWGRTGLSGFIARNRAEVFDLGADRLVRFPQLLVFDLDVLVQAGFEVVATFRSPHVTIAFTTAPEVAVARLFTLPREILLNPAFREEI